MRVPLSWLHEHCAPDLSAGELAARLPLTGTEVDRVEHHGVRAPEHFVLGRVLSAQQHPDADRLKVCSVDVGDGEPAQIVCGAPNVAAGQLVAVARPGAVMPDGTKLKRAKLRGQRSEGMILAEDELAIGNDHDGIMVLADDAGAPGDPLAGVLPIATDVLELEITPNRPDCLGVYGVAREVHATTGAELGSPPWEDDPGSSDGDIGVEIRVETELCPRFTARIFEDVTIAPSPPWLKARLMAAGQRPINNVVDITNYVMLLTAQPLHAFDADRIAGARLVVRRAGEGEQVVTLDDQVRTCDGDMVLIADDEGPTSIAGVMGGNRSEVSTTTTRVLMEAANWDGANIHATSLKLGLRSEASGRFEKGLAPEQALDALVVATKLMLELTGARLVPGTVDVGGAGPEPLTIRLRDRRVVGLLGVAITRSAIALHLRRLGFETAEQPDGLDVTVPYWRRNDVTREADLIEEVARLHGMDEELPATLPRRRGAIGVLTPQQRLRRRAEDALVGRGLHEVVGWSFTERAALAKLRLPDDDVIAIENPMSDAHSILRPTIVASLLDIAAHNVARGTGDLAIFESGAVYRRGAQSDPPADEHHALAGLVTGATAPASWATGPAPRADFFTAKGLVEAVAAAVRVDVRLAPSDRWPFLHPGRSAEITIADQRVGFAGEVHPLVTAEWGLAANPVAIFAIDLGKLAAAAPGTIRYTDLTTFPAVRQDLAIVVPEDVPAADVVELVGADAASVRLFDIYRGEQVGQGRKSLALHCEFSAPDRTLTDEEVARVRAGIVERLAAIGGELRA